MARNHQNGASFYQNDTPLPQPGSPFSTEEMEALTQHRKRYLASAYVNMGFPPDIPSIGQQSNGAAATYQTSTKEETFSYAQTTSGTGCCQTCQGQGCEVDHGRTRYTQILNQNTGDPVDVPVNEDTGTNVNWILPHLVDLFGLKRLEAPSSIEFLDFHGKSYEPTYLVKIPLTGNMSKTTHTEFFIAPENIPIEGLVVGNGFINTVGHPHTIFRDKPLGGKALIMFQKRITETEKVTIQTSRAQADNQATELEKKRIEQKQQRSLSSRTSRGQQKLIAPSSSARRNRKEE